MRLGCIRNPFSELQTVFLIYIFNFMVENYFWKNIKQYLSSSWYFCSVWTLPDMMGIIYSFQNLALENWKQYAESKTDFQSLKLYTETVQRNTVKELPCWKWIQNYIAQLNILLFWGYSSLQQRKPAWHYGREAGPKFLGIPLILCFLQ